MAPKSKSIVDYGYFPCQNRRKVKFEISELERGEYLQVREECLRRKLSENKTRVVLSDLIITFESKKEQIQKIIAKNIGKTYVFFNLSLEAKKFEYLCEENNLVNVRCLSYKSGSQADLSDADNLIYAEHAIVQEYYFIAIETQLKSEAKVFYVQSDTEVEAELEAKLNLQMQRIEVFVKEFGRKKR